MKPYFETPRSERLVHVDDSQDPFPAHFHTGVELIYVLDGTVEILINGVLSRASKNGVVVIDSNDVHVIQKPATHRFMSIPKSLLADYSAAMQGKTFAVNVIRDDGGEILDIINKFRGCYEMSELKMRGYVNLVLAIIMERAGVRNERRGNLDVMCGALNYINTHFAEDVTLDTLSKHFGYNKCYFSETFNKVLGTNLNSYLNAVRLENFVEAVLQRGKNVTEAAYESGFGSINTLYRVFRTRYGESPAEYFERIKGRKE